MTKTITVSIPDATASRSKMQKKGWKCWAKILSSVANPANDGYAYDGEFTSVGATIEAEVGAVILHVDQSGAARVGVVMVNKAGKGFIKWVETATSDGRKWCGTLGRPSRTLLNMPTEERVRHVAELMAKDRPFDRTDEVQAYYETLAGITVTALPLSVDTESITAQIRKLLTGLNDDQVAEVLRGLPEFIAEQGVVK